MPDSGGRHEASDEITSPLVKGGDIVDHRGCGMVSRLCGYKQSHWRQGRDFRWREDTGVS